MATQTDNLEKLKKDILALMKEYNALAEKENVGSRLAMMNSEHEEQEDEDGETISQKDVSFYSGHTYIHITTADKNSENWFPSSICPGF